VVTTPPDDLLVVTQVAPPTLALTVTSPPVKIPYVAPVLKPKPYRN